MKRGVQQKKHVKKKAEEVIKGKEILIYRFFLTLKTESTPKSLSNWLTVSWCSSPHPKAQDKILLTIED